MKTGDKVWVKPLDEWIYISKDDTDSGVRDVFLMGLHELEMKGATWSTLSVESNRHPDGGVTVHFSAYAITPRD